MIDPTLTLDDFNFSLPDALIAQHPPEKRGASRLLHLTPQGFQDRLFSDLPTLLRPQDLLVFNDTRVIKARLLGRKDTGGAIEVMIERILDGHHAIAQIRASKSPKPGSRIALEDAFYMEVIERTGEDGAFFSLALDPQSPEDLYTLTERYGRLPLPPYITHAANAEDESRYQTVYAKHLGAVAAPTAGLHFDEAMLSTLKAHGIKLCSLTLHVGAGTFQPVRVHSIHEHRMHREVFNLPESTREALLETQAAGGRIIAVGTTSLRALESAFSEGSLQSGPQETAIFITPGYRFRVVDCLITNFHLPKSTLLMLVSAFSGVSAIRAAYQHALSAHYRFFSYGDAMFMERQ